MTSKYLVYEAFTAALRRLFEKAGGVVSPDHELHAIRGSHQGSCYAYLCAGGAILGAYPMKEVEDEVGNAEIFYAWSHMESWRAGILKHLPVFNESYFKPH